jgi:diadenosine tetraphosphate (Ap4A) HIT family hydrolase
MGNSDCKFCSLITKRNDLIYEDDVFVMFRDINPKAEIHIQAVPKKHINNINYLNKEHSQLVRLMKERATNYIIEHYGDSKELM